MTNHLSSRDQDDTLDEAYTRWLDENGFSAMREVLREERREDVPVLRSLPTGEALGVFHAVSTRDGVARARDGQSFFALNALDCPGDGAISEIQFGDGQWMLVGRDDLEI